MSRPVPIHRALAALTAMELRLALRRAENLLATLVIPAAVLLFFGTVAVLPIDGRAVDFLLPGTIALAIVATSFVSLGIATGYERAYGVLKRLGGAPVPRWAILGAKALAVLAIESVQIALLVGLAVAVLGWTPGAGGSLLVAILALVLGTVAFAGLGLAMAGALRAEATLALANGLFLVFLLLGGIVLPVDRLPDAIEPVARLLPATALAEALRVGLGGPDGVEALPALGLLAAWAAGAAALAARTFRWE